MAWSVGFGNWIRFWEDKWVDVIVLKLSFPSLFRVAAAPSARIHECFDCSETGIVWNVRFKRDLCDAKISKLSRLLLLLDSLGSSIISSCQDSIIWQ